MITRQDLLQKWEQRFENIQVDSPRLSAQLILMHVLGIDRLDLMLNRTAIVPTHSVHDFVALAKQREQGVPVAYLLGKKEFYGLDYIVNSSVLIPRPETEYIVDLVREAYSVDDKLRILDIGTGSGALAITLSVLFPRSFIVGADISLSALKVARQNAVLHAVQKRVDFVCANLLYGVKINYFDLIVANLPYVPLVAQESVNREVYNHEPHLALFSGYDGLDLYRTLISMLENVRTGLRLLCECDSSHAVQLMQMSSAIACKAVVLQDLSGRERFIDVVF